MNLLLLTFGDNTDNHQQAVFAALSFMRDPHIKRVLVVTDRPDFYRWLCGTERSALSTEDGGKDASGKRGMAAVKILPITAETLSAWQGPQQFFWRIKIQAVAMAVRQYPGQHLLYVDSRHLSWRAHWQTWRGSWTRGLPTCTASRIAWATATAGR